MKDKKKFFSVYIPVFFMFFCQVISSSLVVAQTYYDDDTFYDTDYSEKEAVRREEAEIMSIPVDIPESGIKLTTDAVSESWRFFTKALVDEQNNDYESAMAGFKKTIENAPDNIYVYQHAAEIALDTGHYEDAAKWAEYLVQKDSSTAQNWVLFGNSRWNSHWRLKPHISRQGDWTRTILKPFFSMPPLPVRKIQMRLCGVWKNIKN